MIPKILTLLALIIFGGCAVANALANDVVGTIASVIGFVVSAYMYIDKICS